MKFPIRHEAVAFQRGRKLSGRRFLDSLSLTPRSICVNSPLTSARNDREQENIVRHKLPGTNDARTLPASLLFRPQRSEWRNLTPAWNNPHCGRRLRAQSFNRAHLPFPSSRHTAPLEMTGSGKTLSVIAAENPFQQLISFLSVWLPGTHPQ